MIDECLFPPEPEVVIAAGYRLKGAQLPSHILIQFERVLPIIRIELEQWDLFLGDVELFQKLPVGSNRVVHALWSIEDVSLRVAFQFTLMG